MAQRVFTQTFGVVGAIMEKDGKFLLVQETKPAVKGMWNHPAGWIDVEENPLEAVKREVKEETGYEFEPQHILGIYSLAKPEAGIIHHAIKIIYIGKILGEQGQYWEHEISQTKWFTPEEIEAMDLHTLRDKDIKTMIKDYISGKKYPLDLLTHTNQK